MTRPLISRAREPDTVVTPGNSGFCIIKTTFRVKGNQAPAFGTFTPDPSESELPWNQAH